jgi:hypothetical protein
MVIEAQVMTRASRQVVHQIYSEVDRWHTWDPDTRSASINGAFVTGATGRLAPPKGMSIALSFTDVRPNEGFTCTGGIPGFQMKFEHELSTQPLGTLIVHRVTFSGWLAPIFGRMIGAQLRVGLPKTLDALKRLAESRAAAA